MRPRERDVEGYFKSEVERIGAQHRKVRWLNMRGAPDQFAFGFPSKRYAFCEIKRPGEALQSHQEREAKRMKAAGVTYYLLDSFETVDIFIREMMT